MKRIAAALLLVLGASACSRCGGGSAPASTTSAAPSASAPEAASASAPPAPADTAFPEVRDSGPGRATAALRAALTLHGIAFDAAQIERDCQVDEDGASIDDLEDTADKLGLDVRQVLVPREHVLLPEAKLLPGIVIVEGLEDPESADFVLLYRLEGDRALVMDPIQGRRWIPRAELAKSIALDEVTIAAEDWHSAEADPRFQDSLRARAVALGVAADQAKALVDRAAADPASRALGALDAAVRQLEADPAPAAGDAAAFLGKGADAPASFWSARPAAKGAEGQPQVAVRAAVMLVITGKKPTP